MALKTENVKGVSERVDS